jgi:hypothetical protein
MFRDEIVKKASSYWRKIGLTPSRHLGVSFKFMLELLEILTAQHLLVRE